MNLIRPRSSTTETVTTAYSSRVEPLLRQATVPATVTALLVAHAEMRTDFPSFLVIGTVILSVVIPRSRRAVVAALCLLYGLVYLPVGWLHTICKFDRGDHGDHMMRVLAKVTSLVDGVPLPDWASVPAPGSRADPTSVTASSPAAGAESGNAIAAVPVRSVDLLPPARNAARNMNEPTFDSVLTDMAEKRPTGPIDIVDARPSGRHARAAAPDRAEELSTV